MKSIVIHSRIGKCDFPASYDVKIKYPVAANLQVSPVLVVQQGATDWAAKYDATNIWNGVLEPKSGCHFAVGSHNIVGLPFVFIDVAHIIMKSKSRGLSVTIHKYRSSISELNSLVCEQRYKFFQERRLAKVVTFGDPNEIPIGHFEAFFPLVEYAAAIFSVKAQCGVVTVGNRVIP